MTNPLPHATCDALHYLIALQNEGTRPHEARSRLQSLRSRHPDLQIDLLAEEQAFDHSVHYDALLRCSGNATVSLSYCPERGVPWPLRGVHRWNEGDLVRVNSNMMRMDAAIACLDFIWEEAQTMERLVNMCLMQEELDREPIDLTDAELQEAMDRFRASKKLFKAEDTLRWLAEHGMTQDKLERYVAESAIVPKLRERVAAGQVDEYYLNYSDGFDAARIARFEVCDEAEALELATQIRSGAKDFFAAAERSFGARTSGNRHRETSLFASVERRQVEEPLRNRIFTAAPGDLVGPVPSANGHSLIRVLAVVPAQLNEPTRALIKDIIFEDWLTERRRAAQIEWCWGAANTNPI